MDVQTETTAYSTDAGRLVRNARGTGRTVRDDDDARSQNLKDYELDRR